MNMPMVVLPLPVMIPVPDKKKRVLLVDRSAHKRDLRAEVMRKLGMEVDCAADIGEARAWWRADLYDLVLVNMEKGLGHRDKFCDDIRGATPPQRMAFLVGGPEFLAHLPNEEELAPVMNAEDQGTGGDVKEALSLNLKGLTQRWGLLEASRRISAVRSACSARTQAIRERPAPVRDAEGQRVEDRRELTNLQDLPIQEMQ
jgi:CheY-like chemotaxis protein